jgi:hypothetical protein
MKNLAFQKPKLTHFSISLASIPQPPSQEPITIKDKHIQQNEDGEIVVSNDHPEISLAVDKALEEAVKTNIEISPSDYVKVLLAELERVRKERAKLDATAPNDGGWILDNFPTHPDQLNAMVESNIVPDTFVLLQDNSDESSILVRRWYSANRAEIDEQISKRLASEEEARRLEEQKRAEEIKLSRQIDIDMEDNEGNEAKKAPSEEVKPEEPIDLDAEDSSKRGDTLEKIVEEDETSTANALLNKLHTSTGGTVLAAAASVISKGGGTDERTMATEVEPRTPTQNLLPLKGPETQEFLSSVKTQTDAIRNVQNTIITLTGNDATLIEVNKKGQLDFDDVKTLEECCGEAAVSMEKMFKFSASEFEGAEEEEPEEGEEEEEEEETGEEEAEEETGEEEGDEESFDPSLKEKRMNFGESSYFCPVSLHTRDVLIPGNPEFQAKYREKIFRFHSEEARAAFIENPDVYLGGIKKRTKKVSHCRLVCNVKLKNTFYFLLEKKIKKVIFDFMILTSV